MIIFPGLIGSIARAGKTVVVPPAPLSYSIIGATSIDNSSGIYGNPPPSTITNTLTLNATGTGTETVTINLIDYSPGVIQCSFNEFIQVNSTTITGGSSVSFYFEVNDSGSLLSPVSADLTISGSGGNNATATLIYYPYSGF